MILYSNVNTQYVLMFQIKFLLPDGEHVVTEEKPYTVYLVLGNREEQNKFNNIVIKIFYLLYQIILTINSHYLYYFRYLVKTTV